MTMFSMKPKFDLAEFLAQPAPRGGRSKGRSFQNRAPKAPATPEPATETAAKTTPATDE